MKLRGISEALWVGFEESLIGGFFDLHKGVQDDPYISRLSP